MTSGVASFGLIDRLKARIAADGPMSVAEFMVLALHDPAEGYYARHAKIGADGDFITAPEVSQMFGELIGLWCAQSWLDMGAPAPVDVIELGPGTGALASDLIRAASAAPSFREAMRLTLVEASAPLRAQQAARVEAKWVAQLEEAPLGPALIIANEFLDCLPVRQFVRAEAGWRERVIGLDATGALAFGLGAPLLSPDPVPPSLSDAPPGSVAEVSVAMTALIDDLSARLLAAPARALFIDYGSAEPSPGDTLQAVRGHARESPLAAPGHADLTAHVDFAALREAARACGLDVAGPKPQGRWLQALGIDARTEALARARPDKADELYRQRARLVADDQMGALFKVVCLSSPGLPPPPGFD